MFAECTKGFFDGFRVDARGHLRAGAADGVHGCAGDGALILKVRVTEVVSNVCFGGTRRNRLCICATSSVYAIYLMAAGATRPGA